MSDHAFLCTGAYPNTLGSQPIKQQLAQAYPAAPPADTQRLLLKGKALADNMLVREYSVKDGDTFNLLVNLSIDLKGSPSAGVTAGKGHQRIPSMVLSPSPSAVAPPGGEPPSSSGSSSPFTRSRQNSTTRDITLMLDNATPALAEQGLSTYHTGPGSGRACSRIWDLPPSPADAQLALEEFLRMAKGTLTASEIARVRDQRGPQPSPSLEVPPGDLPYSSGSSLPSTRSRQNSTTRDITLTLDNATPVLAEQEHSTYHAGIANPSSGRACARIWVPPSPPRTRSSRSRSSCARPKARSSQARSRVYGTRPASPAWACFMARRDASGVLAREVWAGLARVQYTARRTDVLVDGNGGPLEGATSLAAAASV
ncbi:hypothetical protein C8J57DRAFT_1730395 [Mycena rebaudengoi]|nr:hypothetical protein C8J57DRAFT_1730395 [Mycena rebaudengoi]